MCLLLFTCLFTDLSPSECQEAEVQLRSREELLSSTYHSIAVEFAGLHDTPGRMKEKGVITVSLLPLSWS